MATPRNTSGASRKRRPRTKEDWEEHLVTRSYEEVDRQIDSGKVSPTTLNYFLRLGGSRAELEIERLRNENMLLSAKANQIESQEKQEELFAEAMKMFGRYSGSEDPESFEDAEEYDDY